MSVGAATDVLAALHRSHGVGYGRAHQALERLPVLWCDWSTLAVTAGPVSRGVTGTGFRGRNLVITVSRLPTGRLVAFLPDKRQTTLRLPPLAAPRSGAG